MTAPKAVAPTRREEIIAIATRLFLERGFAEVTTRAIAQAAGISQPTLYSHFAGKHELLQEICWRWFEVLRARLVKAAAGKHDDQARLRAVCRTYLELAWEQPDQYYIAFVLQSDLGVARPFDERFVAAGQAAYQVLKDVIAPLAVTPRQAEALAQSVWAALHGLATLVESHPLFGWVERKRLLQQHLDLICAGAARPRGHD